VTQPTDEVRLVSVNVGRPEVIGQRRGHAVVSGIRKQPVAGGVLWLDYLNLAGDRQADLRVHGGLEKAVYAYASEHFPAWAAELGRPVEPAAFGENLTTAGVLEADVAIGDVWSWGKALLQVAQPRWPCFKLALHSRTPDMAARFRGSGRTGWYFRVLQPGEVPVAGPMRVVEQDAAGISVHDAHLAALPGAPDDQVKRVLAVAALSEEWRAVILR
jgi:MOSC domain-containing protein YiiM